MTNPAVSTLMHSRWFSVRLLVEQRHLGRSDFYFDRAHPQYRMNREPWIHFGTMPIVLSHASTKCGQWVIGSSVGRNPNAWPPVA
jgi:hypothetical protein